MGPMTKFMIISDTHNHGFKEGTIFPFRFPTPKVDVILHCGDLTEFGTAPYYERALKMFGSLNAELKLVIAGNHDMDLDEKYCAPYNHKIKSRNERKERDEEALEVMTGPLAKEAGVTYLTEGTHNFTLMSGATFTVYASPYTPAINDWGFRYHPHEDRFNTTQHIPKGQLCPKGKPVTSIAKNPMPSFPDVNIVITHGPPRFMLDECKQGSQGCENLLRAVSRARPMLHCFGHIHEGHGAKMVTWEEEKKPLGDVSPSDTSGTVEFKVGEMMRQINCYPNEAIFGPLFQGKKTLFVNAAIMDADYCPSNPPWLVDLLLPGVT